MLRFGTRFDNQSLSPLKIHLNLVGFTHLGPPKHPYLGVDITSLLCVSITGFIEIFWFYTSKELLQANRKVKVGQWLRYPAV